MVRENGVLVAVTDLQSGTWQIARDMFEVLQKELGDKKRDLNEVKINTKVIQEVSNDITTLIKFTSNVKMNNTKILNLTKIDQDTNEITEALNLYKNKLRSAIEQVSNLESMNNLRAKNERNTHTIFVIQTNQIFTVESRKDSFSLDNPFICTHIIFFLQIIRPNKFVTPFYFF